MTETLILFFVFISFFSIGVFVIRYVIDYPSVISIAGSIVISMAIGVVAHVIVLMVKS